MTNNIKFKIELSGIINGKRLPIYRYGTYNKLHIVCDPKSERDLLFLKSIHEKEDLYKTEDQDIWWLCDRLESNYGIELTHAEARYHAKRKTEFALNIEIQMCWTSSRNYNLQGFIIKGHEILVKISENNY